MLCICCLCIISRNYRLDKPAGISRHQFWQTLLSSLAVKPKDVYSSCAEVSGLILSEMERRGDRVKRKDFYKMLKEQILG